MGKLLSVVKNAPLKFPIAVTEGSDYENWVYRKRLGVSFLSLCLIHVQTGRFQLSFIYPARQGSSGLHVVPNMVSTCACHLLQ